MAAALPALAVACVAAIRADAARRDGPARDALAAGGVLVACMLVPGGWLCALALAGPAFVWARRRERHLRSVRWDELAHVAAGDPLSWSGT